MNSHFENVIENDPLNLRRYHSKHYRTVYTICMMIPILLSLSLVFFLMFFMSPRGSSLRIYHRDIFNWNSEAMAAKISGLQFGF
jgi:hypothetical protein